MPAIARLVDLSNDNCYARLTFFSHCIPKLKKKYSL